MDFDERVHRFIFVGQFFLIILVGFLLVGNALTTSLHGGEAFGIPLSLMMTAVGLLIIITGAVSLFDFYVTKRFIRYSWPWWGR